MDVEHAAREWGEQRGMQPPHEAGQHQHVDAALAQQREPRGLVLELAAKAAGRRCQHFDTVPARTLEHGGVGAVAQHRHDATAEPVMRLGQRLEVGAVAGSEHGEPGLARGEHAAT